MKKNLQTLAHKFGVSVVTISNALNNRDGVKESLRKDIKKEALASGYYRSVLEHKVNLASKNILIIISRRQLNPLNMTQSFYLQFFIELVTEIEKKGYHAILSILENNDEDNGFLPKLFEVGKSLGVILIGEFRKKFLVQSNSIRLPKVMLDFNSEDLAGHSILSDNLNGSYLITKYLIEKGHQDIGFIGKNNATSSIRDRYLGFTKAMISNNLTIEKNWILSDRDEEGVYLPIQLPKKLPTAFVCNSDRAAYGLTQQLKARHLIVGKDISLVGYDNDIFSLFNDPPLTTVEVDIPQMTLKAVALLMGSINQQQEETINLSIMGKIIERNSVAKLKGKDVK